MTDILNSTDSLKDLIPNVGDDLNINSNDETVDSTITEVDKIINLPEDENNLNLNLYKKYLKSLNDKINNGSFNNINMFLFSYKSLSDKDKQFVDNSFKYLIFKKVNNLLNGNNNSEEVVHEIQKVVGNILNIKADFDFNDLHNEKLNKIISEINTIRI